MAREQIFLTILLALQVNLDTLLVAYKHKLLSYYIQLNMRYIGPRIQWTPRNISADFYHLYGHLNSSDSAE